MKGMTDADVEARVSLIIDAENPVPHIHKLAADLRWERDLPKFDAVVHIAFLLARRLAAQIWTPGNQEPPNGPPYQMHANALPHPDPWATLCGRRVPRSAMATQPWQVDCPGCIEKIDIGCGFSAIVQKVGA